MMCIHALPWQSYHTGEGHNEQAVRLGRRHNMPPPHLDFGPFDLEVGVGVSCDLGYPCAKFRLPRPFSFRVRADVCDIRQTDADDRLMPPPSLRGRGHNKQMIEGVNVRLLLFVKISVER